MNNTFLTVDGVVVIDHTKVLLIYRTKEPFKDKLVFPGGHVDPVDQNTKYACSRELKEEINIKISPEKLDFLTILDEINRDPRPQRRVSIAYRVDVSAEEVKNCEAGSDAKKIIIREINSITPEEIGFDHYLVIDILKKQIK